MGGAHIRIFRKVKLKLNIGMLEISREGRRAKISRCILAVVSNVGCLKNMIAHNLG